MGWTPGCSVRRRQPAGEAWIGLFDVLRAVRHVVLPRVDMAIYLSPDRYKISIRTM